MDIRASSKRDKMRRVEIKSLRKRVTRLNKLLRKQAKEIGTLKREKEFYGSGGETTGIDDFFAAIY